MTLLVETGLPNKLSGSCESPQKITIAGATQRATFKFSRNRPTYSVLSVRPEALRIKQVELSHR
jgi:hypothetical protein